MFPKAFRNFGRGDGMDDYLLSLGLWRKTIAKDDSSLYRAVAEQIFNTQALHSRVKKTCFSYIERHYPDLVKEWLGPVEIKALSVLYKRDFVIYQQAGKEPINITNFGFKDQVVLCISGGNHYDCVYSRPFMESSALCQSILYEILYENVFGVEHAAKRGQEMITTKPLAQVNKQNSVISVLPSKLSHQYCAACEPPVLPVHEKPSCHSTPFPYKVAKALSVDVFRNVEYDAWLESKKEEQNSVHQDNGGVQPGSGFFTPGDKCQVLLEGHGDHQFNAHVQEIKSDSESAVVFVEELGERQVVQWSKMTSLPKLISLEPTWKKRGKKKICECSRNISVEGDSYMGSKSRPPPHCQFVGRRTRINSAGLPIKTPVHDIYCYGSVNLHGRQMGKSASHAREMASNLGPRLKHSLRQRYNSEGHYSDDLDTKQFDDSVFSEQQNQKDQQLRSRDSKGDIPAHQWNSGDCREPEHGDTGGECETEEAVTILPAKTGNGSQHVPMEKTVSSLTTSTMVQVTPDLSSSVIHPPSGYLVALPYQNIVIPVGDNFSGPINLSISPSMEANGSDLPFHDNGTLRFFFNLGVQYYRSVSLVQQQTQQSAPPYYSYPPNGNSPGAMCISPQGPMMASEVYALPENEMFTGGAYYFSSPSQCPVPPFFQFGTAAIQYQQGLM